MDLKVVAIGGGSMLDGATAAIDKEIISLTGKKKPRALFIPTAKSDDPGYCETFRKVYGERLGCLTDDLLLLTNPPTAKQIREKISGADIIYVGGGNTLKMMRRWRFLGVDKMLLQACRAGKVMAGTSAGAICWFQYGHSDSMAYYHPEAWDWIRVKCLGVLPFTACPHCLKEGRMDHFMNMISEKGGTGIALDDGTAIMVLGEKFKIVHSQPNAVAFKIYKQNGEMVKEILPSTVGFRPIKSLTT
jgi:dipeptidase E